MIPVGARVGIGVLAAALLAGGGILAPITLVAVVAVATAVIALAGSRPGGAARARVAAAVLMGAWLLTLRILVGGGVGGEAALLLPEGRGPWLARVTAIGTPREGTQRLTVALDDRVGTMLAVTAPRYPAVEPGDRVRLDGRPVAPPEGGYGDFLRRSGIAGTLRSAELAILSRASDAAGLLERTRRAAGDALARALPEPAAGLAAGILVGLRDRVDRDLAAAFTATGLSHVVAISGWNIALVAGLVGALAAGRARRTRSVAILVAIVGYTVLAGASPSVVRAAAMAGVALLARESGRPGTAAAALGWAVAILVLAVPANAGDVGLQLSAAATAGLIAWSRPISAILEHRAGWLPGWVREGLGVSLAAQAATLPIVLLAFGRVAPLSPLTNLAVVPLVPLAMAAGTLALAGGGLVALGGPAFVATLAGIPGALVLGLLIAIVRLAAALPLAGVTLPPPVAGGIALAFSIALAAAVFRRRIGVQIGRLGVRRLRLRRQGPQAAGPGAGGKPRPQVSANSRPADRRSRRLLRGAALLVAMAAGVLVVAGATRPDGRVHVVVLDVGQGDAILVMGPTGGRMLVDGGPDPDRLLVALDARVPPWDRRIDLVVLTHPHEDHVAGLPLVLERYRVGRIAEPGMPGRSPGYDAFVAGLAARGTTSARLATGDRFVLDGIAFDVLWPDADRIPRRASDDGREVNDASIVLLGAFEDRRFLLGGDAEADVEEQLVARGLPPVNLLKAGHHGSRTSTTAALVEATRPRVAAVSVGAKNDYGHPSREVLARLAAAGAAVVRTDQVGTIDVALGAAGVEVHTERPIPGSGAEASPAAPSGGVHVGPGSMAGSAPRTEAGRWARLSYDRPDVGPLSRGRRRPPPRARAAAVAPPARVRSGGDRGLARRTMRGARRAGGPGAGRGGRAPPRRGQGNSSIRSGRGPPAWRGIGGMAGRTGTRGARSVGRRAPGDPAAGAGRRPLAGHGAAGGSPRRLRRQAGGPAPGADGRALRGLAPTLPGRLERGRRSTGAIPRSAAGGTCLQLRRRRPGRGSRLRWTGRAGRAALRPGAGAAP